MPFQPSELVSLTKIFDDVILRIPDYQRGYSWGRKKDSKLTDYPKQLKDLWNDLENIEVNSYCHFTGVISLEKINVASKRRWEKEFEVSANLTVSIGNSEYVPYFVVDGQQRLVSLMILLSLLSKEEALAEDKREEAQRFVSIVGNGKTHYLFGYEKDVPSHQFLIGNIFEDDSMEITQPETLYTQNLTHAKNFFKLKLKDINETKKRDLYEKITKKMLFNILEIKSEKLDISLVFETLNYRGKPLSLLELFKNRLIFLITKKHPEKKATQLRKDVISTWQDIYEWLGKNKNTNKELDDDDFLRAFWIMFYNHDDRTDSQFKEFEQDMFENKYKIVEILSNQFLRVDRLEVLLRKLSEAVKYWFFIHNPDFEFQEAELKKEFEYSVKIKAFLRKLLRNTSGGFMKPLILAYFIKFQSKENFEEIEEFLIQVERHNYCVYLFAGRQKNTNRAHFSKLTNQFFRENKNHSLVIYDVKSKTKESLYIQYFYNHIHTIRANNDKFWDWNGRKYTLWEWERDLQGNSKPILTKYDNSQPFQISSGMIKSNAKLEENIDLVDELRYSLGNITINKLNPLKQFNTFEKIKRRISNKDSLESYSNVDIAKKYNEWTAKDILHRGQEILEFIEKRWQIVYSDTLDDNDLERKKTELLLGKFKFS
jgi:uncharacterized protein with ParB-like and HNH nuclease domain